MIKSGKSLSENIRLRPHEIRRLPIRKQSSDEISEEPIEDDDSDPDMSEEKASKYEKYHTDDYKQTPHEYTED